ncbi:MAG: hypothetical protein AAFV33_05335 [Chloroflexota bacterium]
MTDGTTSDKTQDYLRRREAAAQKQRRYRIIFGGVIAATLPFYCAGAILYFVAPNREVVPTSTPTQIVVTEPSGGGDNLATNTVRPTDLPQATNTPVPFQTATNSLGVPPTNTPANTDTPVPTNTPAATNTPNATSTPFPTLTDTPIPNSPTPIPF